MIDYRKLRPSNLTSPQFKHLLLLIYWPVYGILFSFVERGMTLDYKPIECALDAAIPFCEYFVFPYIFWFVFLYGIHIYTLLCDIKAFKKLMYFIMLTYTTTISVYIIFPNMQLLRPTEFERDNAIVDFMKWYYVFDTNTNVCPSLHVVGSFATLFASWNCKGLNTWYWRSFNTVSAILISISTVFVKQHSVIDIVAGVILSFAALPFCFILPDKIAKKRGKAQNQGVLQKELLHK